MKNRYILSAFAVTLLMALICCIISSVCMEHIRKTTFYTQLGLIETIKEKYPELSDEDIIDSLNISEHTEETEKILRNYGITEKDWLAYPNEKNAVITIILCSSVCLLTGTLITFIIILCRKKYKKTALELSDYLARLNHGDYDLDIETNTEDEFSMLKNEIYRTTVKFREQSENSLKDKMNLKNSISDISHQLKTPLTSVSVMLNRLIEDENMPEDVRLELLTDVKHSSTHIIFLVQSLLTLSRLDADAIKMKVENVSVGEIFDICTEKTEILAELREVTVTHSDCREMNLLCDKKWVSEAITNIVKNCIEHSYQGGNVILSAKQNKLFTDITIKDNGCGIPENELPHIFERFYKGTNSNENSIGIGLSLAKTVIEKNRGYIKVKSEVGKGSCFCIRIFNTL